MCGIVGCITTRGLPLPELEDIARRMTAVLVHRGPDDEGLWADEKAGVLLGHRRLAILDLSPLGHQPMVSADGRYVIVYNGEVYNFRSLQRELEDLGHGFRGESDTEVILAAIVQWGVKAAVQRFVGMFAFGLWDRTSRPFEPGQGLITRLTLRPLPFSSGIITSLPHTLFTSMSKSSHRATYSF
jgi:asparagine synthase (glutamine-hydrolysing)